MEVTTPNTLSSSTNPAEGIFGGIFSLLGTVLIIVAIISAFIGLLFLLSKFLPHILFSLSAKKITTQDLRLRVF